ncbi:sugar ABC transporter ATP-binding protein [Clostridiales bacterium BAD-6]|uniref:Sugar ABC transporter ATP-binding protein n=2 Tax=Sinanaerobacter chloroacetimidivorans TaxID=2818044 RepID=A0A8J7W336_9FIRM|nr:sugar ABC transporter ATP-binding protein [Sinanaerobacter chloroacetimidivorans]
MFKMHGITKRFDAVVALNEASFEVEPGEIRALLGSNGSGKSTLVKVLSGLVNPNAGKIEFDDMPVQIHNAQDSRKLGIAVAYQDLSLIQSMSVMDNIVLGMEPKGALGIINRKQAYVQAKEILARLKIDCRPEDLVQNLAPSLQSMIEVAKAISQKPRLLLLDEVTASLHHDEVDILFETLKELKKEGAAIVIVTHRMEEIFKICDNCTILKGGETVARGKMSEMDLNEIVYHMTGKRPDADARGVCSDQNENMDQGEPVLEVKNLVLLPKVKDISVTGHKGEIIGIGGLEGQGQSEFIRTLLGAHKPSSGEIIYKGVSEKFKSPAQAIKKEMGFVSGDRNKEAVFPIRSVAENIFAGKTTKGRMFGYLGPKEINRFAKETVEEFNIKVGSLKHPANSLSGGNQQKLVVGRWIALAPKLLLLDDPTKGVDINSRREIHKILKKCTEEGMTVMISSSDNAELLEIADRIYIFYEGRVSAMLAGENRTEEKLVAAMMGLTSCEGGAEISG